MVAARRPSAPRPPAARAPVQARSRATLDRFLAAAAELLLERERADGASASRILETFVERLVAARRERRGLLRALSLYARSRPGSEFARRGAALNALLMRRLTELLLTRRSEIGHPRPARAVPFALALADALTREAIVFEEMGLAPARLTDRELTSELVTALRAYLRLKEK
jgi:hypothetical protein